MTSGLDRDPLESLFDQVLPLGVAEHLLDGDAVLETKRQTGRLAVLDAAVWEGVVTQQRFCSRPAGLLQCLDQLRLDGEGDLLVPPSSSVVLADVEPDQTSTNNVTPTNCSVVWSTVTSNLSLDLGLYIPVGLLHVNHEAPLVHGGLGGQLVHGSTREVSPVLGADSQHRSGVEGKWRPFHSFYNLIKIQT